MLDIDIIRKFLEKSNCKLYFLPSPYVREGHSIRINTIEDSDLVKMINDFNEAGVDGDNIGYDKDPL